MNSTTENLFALLNVALCGTKSANIGLPINWHELYNLARRQGITAIVWQAVRQLGEEGVIVSEQMPDKALKLQWALTAENITKRYRRQEVLIGKLAAFYGEHNIRMMLLKGYGLSLYYPTPELRECGDIDIWLYGEQKRADELLSSIKGIAIDEDKHHHTTFVIDKILVENHFDFLNVHAHPSNKEIERELRRLSNDEPSGQIEVNGNVVYLPSANLNALFTLRHAAAHFAAAEITLRHILDWCFLVGYNSEKIDWKWLYTIAKQQNMDKFLNCLNAICIDHFNLSSDLCPDFKRNKALEDRVLKDIILPEFSEKHPKGNLIKGLIFKFRRWWSNRWKHRLVYREGLLVTFFVQLYSHALKPKSFK